MMGSMLLLDRPIMFLQYQDISSPVNADYAKQDATLPGTPCFNFTLTIKVSARRVFYGHTKSEKMRHYRQMRKLVRLEKGKRQNLKEDRERRSEEGCEFFFFVLLISVSTACSSFGELSFSHKLSG